MNDREQLFYNEFYAALEKAMESSGDHLKEIDMPKNNSVQKGIVIKFDNVDMAPTIYPDFYYDDWKSGHPMSDIISGIRTELMKTASTMGRFTINDVNRENAPAHLYASVVNYANNKEWLKETPHERIADLAVFARWRLNTGDPDSVFSAKVTEPFLARLQLTKEEMLTIAKTNTKREAQFDSMENVIMGFVQDEGIGDGLGAALPIDKSESGMYVLSSNGGIEGAAVIACPDVLKLVHKNIGKDFFIFPSSIHEVIITPKSDALSVEELKNMVRSINQNDVPVEDRLSDNVYEFDGHRLKLAGMDGLKQELDLKDRFSHHRSR